MKFSLVDFAAAGGSGGAGPAAATTDLAFVAERSGGDALVLRAPVAWQGSEEEQRVVLEAGCARVQLEFRCDELLVRRGRPCTQGTGGSPAGTKLGSCVMELTRGNIVTHNCQHRTHPTPRRRRRATQLRRCCASCSHRCAAAMRLSTWDASRCRCWSLARGPGAGQTPPHAWGRVAPSATRRQQPQACHHLRSPADGCARSPPLPALRCRTMATGEASAPCACSLVHKSVSVFPPSSASPVSLLIDAFCSACSALAPA